MHAMCAVVGRSMDEIRDMLDNQCDDNGGYWDYYFIGGRFFNIIPVRKNVKDRYRTRPPEGETPPDVNGFNFPNLENNWNCKYVTVARVRNIDRDECDRLHLSGCLDPLHPASALVHFVDGSYSGLIDDMGMAHELIRHLFNSPVYQGHYIAIVDYHY